MSKLNTDKLTEMHSYVYTCFINKSIKKIVIALNFNWICFLQMRIKQINFEIYNYTFHISNNIFNLNNNSNSTKHFTNKH